MSDSLIIAGRTFRSRLIVGTGKYKSFQETARALEASGAEMVTVEFTPDNGVLTPTMKLKRRVIEERYKKQIDELYAQAEATAVP